MNGIPCLLIPHYGLPGVHVCMFYLIDAFLMAVVHDDFFHIASFLGVSVASTFCLSVLCFALPVVAGNEKFRRLGAVDGGG